MKKIIGRKEEQNLLKEALTSDEAELVAVVGRRRVGKTFLINKTFEDHLIFQFTGTQNGSLELQLTNFNRQLKKMFGKTTSTKNIPKTWSEAFYELEEYLEINLQGRRKVVFFDEVPWMATNKSNFLQSFAYFWNNWASLQNVVIVICGSATSWIVQKVVFDTGGLHNRITKYLHLQPFTLAETEAFLKTKHLNFTRYQIVEIYMAMGGIPYYH